MSKLTLKQVVKGLFDALNAKKADRSDLEGLATSAEVEVIDTKIGGKDDSADDTTNGSVFARLRAIINKIGTPAASHTVAGDAGNAAAYAAAVKSALGNSQDTQDADGTTLWARFKTLFELANNLLARESNATTNKQAVMQHVSDTFIKVAYTEANVMPVCTNGQGCCYLSPSYTLEQDEASYASYYQIGDIIKCTGRGSGTRSNVIFSAIQSTPSYQGQDVSQVPASTITWEVGHYYRVKDIVTVYSNGIIGGDSINFFVYEELPATVVEGFDQTKEAVQAAKQAIKGSDAAATLTAIYAHLNGGGSLPADVQQQLTLILNYLGSPAAMACEGMTPQEVVDELEDIFGIMGLDIAPCSVDSEGNVTAPSES